MAKVYCEICGASLVSSRYSTLYTCENCGMKYTRTKVRKMLSRGPRFRTATIGDPTELEKWYAELDKHIANENLKDAEDVAQRILEIDPEDEKAGALLDLLVKMEKEFRIERGILVKYSGEDEVLTIPAGVREIGERALMDNCHVKKVIVHAGVKSIGEEAFSGCDALEEVELPDSVRFIGYRAFANCVNLRKINMPDTITFLGNYAFYHCCNLEEIHIPKNVPTIGKCTFAGCASIKDVVIPRRIKGIGNNAFRDCTSLKTIGPLDEVMFLGENAFLGCDSLEDITVPYRFMNNGWEKYESTYPTPPQEKL
ncbi:MAG: leucine-rich repeat domain-containing protein [Firmicutes bacterium]|nr:leucine-rich repeat domain-containing protein [Bacillota bacterium]